VIERDILSLGRPTSRGSRPGRNAFVDTVRSGAGEGMAKRDEAALKLLRWELEGRGDAVLAAMLRHPDLSLADSVDLIEQEIAALSPKDPASELPVPSAPRGRASSELDALGQEFQTFRHLLRPREAKEVEATLKELARTRDREAMAALRRRLR